MVHTRAVLPQRQGHAAAASTFPGQSPTAPPPLLGAGHETTAAVCTWTLFCLMQNEAAEAKILAEIDSVVGDRVPSEWAVVTTCFGL